MRLPHLLSRCRPTCWTLSALFLVGPLTWATPSAAQAPASPSAQKVRVEVGTIVDLVFDTAMNPKTAAIGQTVMLKVSAPVKVGNLTIIAAGAAAIGEVTRSEKAGAVGMNAAIGVTVKQVTAVDGTVIPLSGTKMVEGESHQTSSIVITVLCCILGLLQQGGQAEIAAGATLRATVLAPIDVVGQ